MQGCEGIMSIVSAGKSSFGISDIEGSQQVVIKNRFSFGSYNGNMMKSPPARFSPFQEPAGAAGIWQKAHT